MTNPIYRDIGPPELRLIEEMAELTHVIIKAKRFGLDNYHPRDANKITNVNLILSEMKDVRRVMMEYEEILLDQNRLVDIIVIPGGNQK